jgi:hypothetical protein
MAGVRVYRLGAVGEPAAVGWVSRARAERLLAGPRAERYRGGILVVGECARRGWYSPIGARQGYVHHGAPVTAGPPPRCPWVGGRRGDGG